MATTIEQAPVALRQLAPEQRIVIQGIDWPTYMRLAEAIGDQHVRLAYNRGALELMSPGVPHEDYNELLNYLVKIVTLELDIPCRGYGSATWNKPEAERSIEADSSYYFTPEKIATARHRSKNSADYPFPDLAIEVDISPSRIDRPAIYAALGVAEVWRFNGETLRIDRLRDDGTYEPSPSSRFLPILPAEVARWVLHTDFEDDNDWFRQVAAWVRAEVAPRRA